jgi:bifunctional non-homologous end joining protein LigD
MKKVIRTNTGQKIRRPGFVAPQLATLVAEAPAGDDWLNEIKLDGYRMLCRVHEGVVTIWSRNQKDWTAKLPTLAKAMAKLRVKSALFDGEVVSLDDEGKSDFARLKVRIGTDDQTGFVYDIFDLLFLDGEDLRGMTLVERKKRLKRALTGAPKTIRYLDHIVGDGPHFMEQACQHHLEGIIAKPADSTYQSGRTNQWLKIKCTKRQELVVAGYTQPSEGGYAIGSLILGVHDKKKGFIYAGRVGTGFDQAERKRLKDLLDQRALKRPPFASIPKDEIILRTAQWARPELVAEIEFTEWTPDGRLRHPSYKGLREDKEASAVVRENPKPLSKVTAKAKAAAKAPTKKAAKSVADKVEYAGVKLSSPERELFPEGITKLDLFEYYRSVEKWIMPHIADRPLTLVRCPGGIKEECFFQKHASPRVPLPKGVNEMDPGDGGESYLNLNSLTGLLGMVQLGTIEFHISGAHIDKPDYPDRLVFDLDPAEGIPAPVVIKSAREMRARLADLGLETFVMTTGGKGIHVVAPIARTQNFETVRDFAHRFADGMERDAPDRYIAESGLAKRPGKIFLDYMRNGRAATAICPFAVRARANAPVAVTLTWEELKPAMLGSLWNVKTIARRLKSLKGDPWADYGKVRQSITKAMLKAV